MIDVSKLVNLKANILGTVAIACLASLTTSLASNYLFSGGATSNVEASSGVAHLVSSASAIDCGDEVYSPVQKKCVDQETFDMEMQRLFAALGIDTSIYGLGEDND